MFGKRIYLDNASTTLTGEKCLANANSLHKEGVQARNILEDARKKIAGVLDCRAGEIIFNSGATEGNREIIGAFAKPGAHIITTKIEHKSVLDVLEKSGADISYVEPNKDAVLSALKPNTKLISIMYANNEVGTVLPVKEICRGLHALKLPKDRHPFVHTDATQAPGLLSLNMQSLGVDFMTLSAHKFYGPKGVGLVYARGDARYALPKGGTPNVAGIVGLARALEIAENMREREVARLSVLQNTAIAELKKLPGVVINGPDIGKERLANNINFSIPGLEGEQVVLELDARGIACGSGSACSSRDTELSHVIMALTGDKERALGSVRWSMGRNTTIKHIKIALRALEEVINKYKII